MDSWGWEQIDPWLQARERLPVGALFCIINGPSRGRPWTQDAVRVQLRRAAAKPLSGAGLRRTSYDTPTPWRWLAKACRSS